MKSVLFIAHDPGGGGNVVRPVYDYLRLTVKIKCYLWLTGPSGERDINFKMEEDSVMKSLAVLSEREELILITGTSWDSQIELEAIRFCKSRNIITIAILDYWSNYLNRFQLDGKFVLPDFYFVMDELAMQEAQKEGIDISTIRVVGHPGLDIYTKNVYIQKKSGKLLFLSQPISELYGDSLGYTEYDVARDIRKAGAALGYGVDIKFHPKDSYRFFMLYERHQVDGIFEEVVLKYDVVIGMNTMGLLQCALMGIPIISYQPKLKKADLSITNKLGLTKGAFSYQELIERIRNASNYCLPKDRHIWMDGNSTKRCADMILSIGGF